MAITMSYLCKDCQLRTGLLDSAQRHADQSGHTLFIEGSLTPAENAGVTHQLDLAQRKRLSESIILAEAARRKLAVQKPLVAPELPDPAPTQPQTFEALLGDHVTIAVDQLRWQTFEKIKEMWTFAGHLAHNVLNDRQVGKKLSLDATKEAEVAA